MSVKKLLDLTGKIALVTGGSRGLGLQIAEGLGEMGAKLALTARKAEELEQAREHLAMQNIEALALRCDLSQPEAIAPMLSKLPRLTSPPTTSSTIPTSSAAAS